jgi:hypothetical protein
MLQSSIIHAKIHENAFAAVARGAHDAPRPPSRLRRRKSSPDATPAMPLASRQPRISPPASVA